MSEDASATATLGPRHDDAAADRPPWPERQPRSAVSPRGSRVDRAAVSAAIALLLLSALVAILLWSRSPHPPAAAKTPARGQAAPVAPPPAVVPVRLVAISPQDARALNATVPFSALPNPAAKPFHFAESTDARARAVDCLASAVLYEAGDDAVGQKAVAQVVLNRVRHPAFPNTICGVVFQGAERSTGCQFTFTCDGALTRVQSLAAWEHARLTATAALDGEVFAPVGYSTHYHTDWVVPYWQTTLDKITAVHTHLFFRWRGWWGTPAAFTRRPDPAEPTIAQLAPYSSAHREAIAAGSAGADGTIGQEAGAAGPSANATSASVAIPRLDVTTLKGSTVRLADTRAGAFFLQLDPAAFSGSYALAALATCQKRTECTVYGFLPGDAVPPTIAAAAAQPTLATFVYRSAPGRRETALWNCGRVARSSAEQCLPGTAPAR